MKDKHVQCRLRKPITGEAYKEQVSFIPEKYASVGRVLKLRNCLEEWEDGWVVEDTYVVMPSDLVVQNSHAWTKQRKTSDI